MNKSTKSKVAVVQAATVEFSVEKTLQKLTNFANEAATNGAKLVLFPEAFVGGYPRGLTFGATVGERTAEGRDQFRDYYAAAVDIPGPATKEMAAVASRNGVYLVVGIIERERGTLYCTVVFFSPEGKLIGKHRKLMPTGSERLVWGFGDGSTLPVFDTPLGRIGAVICWENYMPLLRYANYAKGIQIYLAPTADGRETWLSTMRHIAMEGRCFVLSCNQFSRRCDFPEDYPSTLDSQTVLSRGGSCIISPLGEILAGPNCEGEGVLYAEVDLTEITRGKYDFDVTGHYSRPDVFALHVDERPKSPAIFQGETSVEESESLPIN